MSDKIKIPKVQKLRLAGAVPAEVQRNRKKQNIANYSTEELKLLIQRKAGGGSKPVASTRPR